jgi:hypothetical protein
VIEPFLARYDGIKYSYMIELKYIPVSETKVPENMELRLEKLKKEAETQLNRYSGDEKFKKTIGKTTLIKLVLIFSGGQLKYIGETG